MNQPIPLAKQSKRTQKEHHKKQRGSWYGLSPVTQTVPNKKVYHRKGAKAGMDMNMW